MGGRIKEAALLAAIAALLSAIAYGTYLISFIF